MPKFSPLKLLFYYHVFFITSGVKQDLLVEKLMTESFPEQLKDTRLQLQELQQILSRIYEMKSSSR